MYEIQNGSHLNAIDAWKDIIKHGYDYYLDYAHAAALFKQAEDLQRFQNFVKKIELDNDHDSTYYSGKYVIRMHVYMTTENYRSAILSFIESEEIESLLEAFESIEYENESTIATIKNFLSLSLVNEN